MSVTQALTATSARNESAASSTSAPERTRLHITPFNPDLLKSFIPSSILPQATGISYHSVQTFPEKGYGYVELPTMDAQKLKKKLNGSILKGRKVRIEDARPEKRKRVLEEAQAAETGAEEQDSKAGKKVKKAKRRENVLPGFELPDSRHVKRGWTEPEGQEKAHRRKDKKDKDKDKKDKKHKSQPSKYTTEPELLFKTKLPPNAVPTAKSEKAVEKPKKSKKSSREVIVHEFEKTTKHASFLKSNQIPKDAKSATEYVEGKGWVDEEGYVVEPESESRRKRKEAKAEAERLRREREAAAAAAAAEKKASKSTNKRHTALERAEAIESKKKSKRAASPADEASESDEEDDTDGSSSVVSTSSSDVSSSSEEESEEMSSSEAESEVSQDVVSDEESSPKSESPVAQAKPADETLIPQAEPGADVEMADSSAKPGETEEEDTREVHPLEALFKRPKLPENSTPNKLTPINTSFSFFGGGGDDEEAAEEEATQPLTPYTRQDLQFRGIRSAAPTPDTAAIGKRFWREDVNDEEEDEESDLEDSMMHVDANSVPLGTQSAGGPSTADQGSEEGAAQSEFAKHFWENRGEYNRTWKKRRREALKVQRQRENRRLGRKVV